MTMLKIHRRAVLAGTMLGGAATLLPAFAHAAITGFLARNGDPYARIGSDSASRVQMALGSSGVPETFVVDGRGIVVKQIIGDIRPEQVDEIVQAVRAAR